MRYLYFFWTNPKSAKVPLPNNCPLRKWRIFDFGPGFRIKLDNVQIPLNKFWFLSLACQRAPSRKRDTGSVSFPLWVRGRVTETKFFEPEKKPSAPVSEITIRALCAGASRSSTITIQRATLHGTPDVSDSPQMFGSYRCRDQMSEVGSNTV